MTTISTMIRTALLISMSLLISLAANAQDQKAQKILDAVSKKYDAYANLTIDIDMVATMPDEDPLESKVVIIQAKEKFKIVHPEQSIYCDGNDVWMYIPDQNEVQINDYDPEEDSDFMITPRDLLSQYKSGDYDYRLAQTNGDQSEIEFKPIAADSDYAKYKILINTKRNEIETMWAIGKDGSIIKLDIISLKANQKLASDEFTFDLKKYPGVRVEDLRLD